MKYSFKYMEMHRLFKYIDPYVNIAGNGMTLILSAFGIFLFGRYVNNRYYDLGKTLLAALVTAGVAVQTLKHLAGRARPRLTLETAFIGPTFQGSYDSFPSGHAVMVFCLAYVLSKHFPKHKIIFYLLATIVGLDRIIDGSHFASDVLAGMVIGIVVANAWAERKASPGIPTSQ